jgi:hypothetical protein
MADLGIQLGRACLQLFLEMLTHLVIHGVRAIRVHPIGTRIDPPMFRDENGVWRRAITLPDEICGPIGRAVLDELVERRLAVRGPAL